MAQLAVWLLLGLLTSSQALAGGGFGAPNKAAKKKQAKRRAQRRQQFAGIKGCQCCWKWLAGLREKQKLRDLQLFTDER